MFPFTLIGLLTFLKFTNVLNALLDGVGLQYVSDDIKYACILHS